MMRIRDAFGIYNVLETIMKKADRPLTCVEFYDDPDVKKFADSVNRVSDYLGHMYRRGLLGRTSAPKTYNSQARWGYFWKARSEVTKISEPRLALITPRKILAKPNITITDNGNSIVIDLPGLSIAITSKN